MTKNFKELFELLKPHIDSYTWCGFFIKKELGGSEVVGISARASSIIRKNFTMDRVDKAIKVLQLPFRVIDPNEATPYFQILIEQK